MASQVPSLLTLTKLRLILGFRVSKVPGIGSTYLLTRCCSGQSDAKSRINQTIDKDSPKVVHSFNVEDIRNKAVYCRCWRSKKFPYCDGSHGKHNAETGDNVGPLIIKRTTPE